MPDIEQMMQLSIDKKLREAYEFKLVKIAVVINFLLSVITLFVVLT